MYWFINDHLGTPQKIVNNSGQVVWAAAYLPFGKAQVTTETVANNFRFPGQYSDAESGLHYNWHRYYDPETGRYITADPIGLKGGVNLYSYVLNNPANLTDPSGLDIVVIDGREYDDGRIESDPAWLTALKAAAAVSGYQGVRVVYGLIKIYRDRIQCETQAHNEAHNAANYEKYREHLRQLKKYGEGGSRELENGRIRYYGEIDPAMKPGEMAGRRVVREWDPVTGNTRTWHETIDHNGNVRQVRPQLNDGSGTKTHHRFDENGNFIGSW